ncbi:hypothetical protein GPJ56_006026 [Histomonas meleagridis]|uniref:uncharacterized protein n=1 Tax=Histomonas meleagridis TaxID=135588 RepID=UPI00355A07F2|nr:hypothetical protein GPJ56_006026 [Histomonas meleagridis]KAH0799433.1 hypothetical protein GO595_007834 [Histomonas meleagridis]
MNTAQEARNHLNQMIFLVNTLISESINESNPTDPPIRKLSKDQFLAEYKEHSSLLTECLNTAKEEEHEPVDEELKAARAELNDLVLKLEEKTQKLGRLCFWVENMNLNA